MRWARVLSRPCKTQSPYGGGHRHRTQPENAATCALRCLGSRASAAAFTAFEAVHTQQPQHQRQRQIGLHHPPARPQKPRDVGGGRMGACSLRHRRDDGQHLGGLGNMRHRAAHAFAGRSA